MTKVKVITNDIVQNTNTQRIIFKVLISSLITLFIVYVYLIGSITFNILARKSLETTVLTLGSRISEIELTYLNNTNKINKNYALTLGFVDVRDNIFASRKITRVALK